MGVCFANAQGELRSYAQSMGRKPWVLGRPRHKEHTRLTRTTNWFYVALSLKSSFGVRDGCNNFETAMAAREAAETSTTPHRHDALPML
jgi:hypothetical protein